MVLDIQIKERWRKITAPVYKSKRELVSNIYFSFVGVLVAILTIKNGGWVGVGGWIVVAMLIILFFTPEN